MAVEYTFEICKTEAAKYKTRTEFSRGNQKGYETARKAGWLDLLIPLEPTKTESLTFEEARNAAAPFNSRRQFQLACSGIYQAAKRRGFLDEITAHYTGRKKPDGYWSKEKCREEALKWGNVTDFKRKAGSAYQKCSEMGWGDDVYGDLEFQVMPSGYWTKERVMEVAKNYTYRLDFKHGESGAYCAALRDGYGDEAMAHMEDRRQSDMDVIYLWEATGESYNGRRVFKIGVTSDRIGAQRINQVADKAGMKPRIILMRWLGRWNVPDLEQYLLTFGEDPKLDVPDGRTEFRALTDEELQTIIKIIESHPIL